MSHYKKSSDQSVPFSTSRDNFTSDYFPFSSQPLRRGNSSFNSTRDKILHNLSEFEDQLPSNKMFVDRSPFGSSLVNHPRMSGSRNLDMSNSFRDEMDDQVIHHPRVFNIPIQVETPEGFVPLVRSSSNRGNMAQLRDDASDFTCGSPSERSGYIHQRPFKSPTPPPKPKFNHNHHQPYPHNPEPYFHSHPRVHSIPVKIERSFKPQQPANNDSNSPQPFDEVSHPVSPPNHGSFFGGRRSRSSSESESHQPDACGTVNIPIQIVKTQSNEPQLSESQTASTESNAPANHPKPCDNKEKTSPDPLELIKEIEQEACRLEKEVINFNGECSDKQYRYLDEMLTRCMLKLDSIDSNGRDEVRMARRSTLAHVDHCVAILEGKVNKPKPEEDIDEMSNQCEEQAETATMESEPIHKENEETIPNESTVSEINEEPKDEMMEPENNSDDININSVDEQEQKSTPVNESVNAIGSNCKPDEVSNDQLDVETSSADSTRVNLDDTAHNSLIDQMSQDIEVNEFDNSLEPKVEFPPDSPDEIVDKESVNTEIKESPDSEETLNEQEESTASKTESLVDDNKSSNN